LHEVYLEDGCPYDNEGEGAGEEPNHTTGRKPAVLYRSFNTLWCALFKYSKSIIKIVYRWLLKVIHLGYKNI
jgi:hypothetical protein